jgi:hypothetical protein
MQELRRGEGRLCASPDPALGWRSFTGGAMSSGYRVARDVDSYLLDAGVRPASAVNELVRSVGT